MPIVSLQVGSVIHGRSCTRVIPFAGGTQAPPPVIFIANGGQLLVLFMPCPLSGGAARPEGKRERVDTCYPFRRCADYIK